MKLIRSKLKSAIADSLYLSGARHVFRGVNVLFNRSPRVWILAYHRVVESFQDEVKHSIPGLLISAKTLRRQLETAHRLGFDFVSLDEGLRILTGQTSQKNDVMVVTFDDAYADVFENGLPVLKSMGIPSIMYVPTGFIGTNHRFIHDRLFHLASFLPGHRIVRLHGMLKEFLLRVFRSEISLSSALDTFISRTTRTELEEALCQLEAQTHDVVDPIPTSGAIMNWNQLADWNSSGMCIGAHTVNHLVLPLESQTTQANEITESKNELERVIGRPIRHFAFCNGWYSQKVIGALSSNGFHSAVTTEADANYIGSDPFRLKRKVLWENFSLDANGEYSAALTACHLEGMFGSLGITRPVSGVFPDSAQ